MKSIKELVEEYNVELVFTTLNKRACFDPTYGIISVSYTHLTLPTTILV